MEGKAGIRRKDCRGCLGYQLGQPGCAPVRGAGFEPAF